MKPQRLVYSPTRSRRLNEMLGLVVLVAAGLLLLSLLSYTPTDPSFNTVSGATGPHSAHNWTGLIGAYVSDVLLQTLGISVLFLPLVMIRLGLSWMRSRAVGSTKAKVFGLALWLMFAPASIYLLPGHLLWKHTLPFSGVVGRLLSDGLIQFVNLPGTIILCVLMVAFSLYLTTTFTLATAREWFTSHFAFIRNASERYTAWKESRRKNETEEAVSAYETKRERATAKARSRAGKAPVAVSEIQPASTSLLSSFLGWFGRRKNHGSDLAVDPNDRDRADFAAEAPSMWQTMPRTMVDEVPLTGLSAAAAAAAPYAAQLAAASTPLRAPGSDPDLPYNGNPPVRKTQGHDDGWLDAPERGVPISAKPSLAAFDIPEPPPARIPTPRPQMVQPPLPPMPSPTQDIAAQNIAFGKRADADMRAVAMTTKSIRGYKLPPSSLLYRSEEQAQVREDELRQEARTLVEKCAEFGVDGNVEQINPGPVVTTFEFRPDAGVKYSRVTGLADDLCLAMAAESILIERMPGKSTVGIQVPNHNRETIWLRDVVECESFAQSKSKLPIALGKDISGRIVTGDLASMPHVLIAGSTGSGKSVAINAMIMSVLFKSTPEQVRMIMVDPKRVELGMYEGIPHLFTPIITEAKLAANALRNAVREMERRLKLLAANHVRNIDQFNKLFDHGSDYLFEDVNQEPLPYIMIIIDELADLMMLDRANVEEAITRLAQMARAVGIHLVLATQRPSVDVITGLIKANVPTRMSFRLATKVDSRTIIDSNGAESLLGRGDMLFLPPGTSRLQRVHAPFVTEKEISAVTEFWKAQGTAEYVEGFLEGPKDEKGSDGGSANDGEDNDPMFDDAVRLVFEFGKASTSLLQRRLRIGYGRAAHLIDMMERDGLVGPADGSKPREILKSPGYFAEVDAASR
ncbi:DNA translocase FtsK [Granulicella mallensis]|uniref:S-DNA-T family DNA segregation ATPase FtsK/SpoIIIE n=1 Tax=Granulicella mallensis TaxID=940614 RepID=A0A7W7ZU75_9BACT|nr:DNA translocase FtsK [Granulicella mallensis]MBB5065848.1 S-DNA-T family DNA segregation ATPase FtsK/SpoIIIE [Granulicella mallensis]